MPETNISVKLDGFDPITKAMEAAARLAEAHNKYLELMTPEQRAKVVDMELADRQAWADFGAPFRKLFERIAGAVKE